MQLDFGFSPIKKSAVLSDDETYRYLLSRKWDVNGITMGFICLNPSIADAEIDDPTVKKCIRLARKWGGGGLIIGNLFAFRSTDPMQLRIVSDPIGDDNDYWLDTMVDACTIIVAAWGTHGVLYGRDQIVMNRFKGKLSALRITKNGMPSHPLYLPEDLKPFIFDSGVLETD